MRSKDFVSVFFITTTSGHNVQKWKGIKMSRKNGKKLLIVIAVGAVVVKAVRDVQYKALLKDIKQLQDICMFSRNPKEQKKQKAKEENSL